MTRTSAFIAAALLLASCRNSAANVVLASLERTERIDLLCAEIEQVTGNTYRLYRTLPLEICDADTTLADDPGAPEADAQSLGAVTQTESGTVGVVNFSNGAIFDTSRTVPGVTALRVGEQPTAIQISAVDSRYTYVTSFSPKSVQAISTREVITGSPVRDYDGDNVPDEPVLPREELRFDAGPSDLALHEAAEATITKDPETGEVTDATTSVRFRYLYAAIPELGQIVQIEVDVDDTTGEQTFVGVTELPLPTHTCDTVTAVAPPVSSDTDYHRICPEYVGGMREAGRIIKDVTTTTPCTDGPGTGPMPVALTIDPGIPNNPFDDALLVADANQPVIHRFSIGEAGAVPQTPIVTLSPTNQVVVTPFVPASSEPADRAAALRYVYAVSATDSSVLAVDYTPGSTDFGAVLPVVAGISPRANEEGLESRNRVRSAFSNARWIEVVAPSYALVNDGAGGLRIADDDSETDICDPNDPDAFALAQNARNMRGVFLAVSVASGSMFFLDVYDLNAPCRGGEGDVACTLAETSSDQFASIRRHRRRWEFTPSTFISIDGTPSLQFNAAPGVIDEGTGLPSNSDGPGLERIECPLSQTGVFGSTAPDEQVRTGSATNGLICASSQVWSSFSQRWDARWQGLIPYSEGGLGLFSDESFQGEPGDWFLAGDVPFCKVGVIGEQDGTPAGSGLSIDELQAYVGDRLVITGELPLSTRDDEQCVQQFSDLLDDIEDRQVWFPIIDAYEDQLEIGPSPDPDRYTLAEVQRCFNQFTEYQIHTRSAYTVTGTTSSFVHRIVADPANDGLCIFDPERPVDVPMGSDDPFDVDTFLTGRAFPSAQFINPLVSFEITDFGPTVAPTDSTVALLSFSILNQFALQTQDTSSGARSLPASMLFSPEQDQLYFVDFEEGVRRIAFSPLSIVQTFD